MGRNESVRERRTHFPPFHFFLSSSLRSFNHRVNVRRKDIWMDEGHVWTRPVLVLTFSVILQSRSSGTRSVPFISLFILGMWRNGGDRVMKVLSSWPIDRSKCYYLSPFSLPYARHSLHPFFGGLEPIGPIWLGWTASTMIGWMREYV